MNPKIKFFILRLKNASFSELIYRVKEKYFLFWLKSFGKNKVFKKPSNLKDQIERLNHISLPSFSINPLDKERLENRKIDANEISLFEKKYKNTFFAKIKETENPDIRIVWEGGRLKDIIHLLLYEKKRESLNVSQDNKTFAKYKILRWIEENPFLMGPHYISSMECALRIPVFFSLLKMIEDLTQDEYKLIINAIYQHTWFVSKRLSLYSSLGNHTIAEAVGLIFGGALFQGEKEGKNWLKKGIKLLEKELTHQFLEDGGPVEQSLNYHRFNLDLYWLSIDFLEKNQLHNCKHWKQRLVEGEKFYKAFQMAGELPYIGDSDDSHAIAPGINPKRDLPEFDFDRFTTFENSGYTLIKGGDGLFLIFDHGPLGMAPLYAHGHADALSIILSKNGYLFLIDPGTFRYNGVPEWRKYFKGTRAHNTVTIDGQDQAIFETSFIWSKPYRTQFIKMEKIKNGFLFSATHNGYQRLKESVLHKRTILWIGEGNFLIKDTFSGKGIHEFELNYHLHPEVEVEKEADWLKLMRKDSKIFMKQIDGAQFELISGQEKPILGWYSDGYGIKKKTTTLQCKRTGQTEEISFLTAISSTGSINIFEGNL